MILNLFIFGILCFFIASIGIHLIIEVINSHYEIEKTNPFEATFFLFLIMMIPVLNIFIVATVFNYKDTIILEVEKRLEEDGYRKR